MCARRFLACLLVTLCGSAAIWADTYFVNPDCGDDAWSGVSPDCVAPDGPKATIQAAVDAAIDGDEVVLAVTTYTGDGNRDVDFLGKAITVRSFDPTDPEIVAATVIDCQGSEDDRHRAFKFISEEGPDSVLAGVTILNGYAPVDCQYPFTDTLPQGGAILCLGSSPTIQRCVMINNVALSGGAIYSEGGSSYYPSGGDTTMLDCEFIGNEGLEYYGGSHYYCPIGGAVHLDRGNPTVAGCLFLQNATWGGGCAGGGGAIFVYSNTVLFADCEIRNNTAEGTGSDGGGILNWDSDLLLENCTITGNWAVDVGGGMCGNYSSQRSAR